MEKIQIQVTESDYKVCYEYCLKYYQAHDTARKLSVHAFLDLFLKGVIPVDKEDIRQAHELLLDTCEKHRQESTPHTREDDSIRLIRIRACSDILSFCGDLEKIFRLIRKRGVSADYLTILGTFSRVIEEDRLLPLAEKFSLESETLESMVRPLTGSIGLRLGTDPPWRTVLRELTFIAARFNMRSTVGPKFDQDVLQLVAPAVVAHFDNDVPSREILSVLPAYFEESELGEFESFLNKTSERVKTDQEADISWDSLNQPLVDITAAIARQRKSGHQGKSGPQLPASPVSPERGQSDAGSLALLFPALDPSKSTRTFDLVIIQTIKKPGETYRPALLPPDIPPAAGSVPAKPGIQRFVPYIIGVAVILVFIIGIVIVSGGLDLTGKGNVTDPAAATRNATIKSNATSAPKTTTATPAPVPVNQNVTTAPKTTNATVTSTPKNANVTSSPTPTPAPQSYSSADIGNHLVEIAFGPDNNNIDKPVKPVLSILVTDKYESDDIATLNSFNSQFNNYSSTTKLAENTHVNNPGDIMLDFMPGTSISQIELIENTSSVNKDPKTGIYHFLYTSEKTYVNSDLKGDERKRWILRGLLFNLGFFGETSKYPDSLFYTGTTKASQLSDIDLKALQLMYGKKITNGMTKTAVKAII